MTKREREQELDAAFHVCKDLGFFSPSCDDPELELACPKKAGEVTPNQAADLRRVMGFKLVAALEEAPLHTSDGSMCVGKC